MHNNNTRDTGQFSTHVTLLAEISHGPVPSAGFSAVVYGIYRIFPAFLLFSNSEANMQSLLRWSIENSGSSNDTASGVAPPSRRTDLDPGIIDAILGRPDSELMKEALARAQDASLDEDARLTALDDLEMVMSFPAHSCVASVNGFFVHIYPSKRLTLFLVRRPPPLSCNTVAR